MRKPKGFPQHFEAIHRDEWARSVSGLCKLSGDVQLAEDCVQEAFSTAVEAWKVSGIPENPGAWLRTVARRRFIDFIRRRRTQTAGEAQILFDAEMNAVNQPEEPDTVDNVVGDDELALIFLCCHPAISATDQVMLTLRIVAGMPPREIAAAFFADHEAVRTRLLRAKRKIQSAKIPIALPPIEKLEERFRQVHTVLYLIFNEGYLTTRGKSPQRADLTREAIRLGKRLILLAPDNNESHGLMALLLLTDARSPARISKADTLVTLEEQNRDLWRKDQIIEGFNHIRKAFTGTCPGRYTLQAAIAAEHAKAATYAQTNWLAIVKLYDHLIKIEDFPVYHLNRCIALSFAEGPHAALQLLSDLSKSDLLEGNYQLHAIRADLLARTKQLEPAMASYQLAINQLEDGAIKASLLDKVENCKLQMADKDS